MKLHMNWMEYTGWGLLSHSLGIKHWVQLSWAHVCTFTFSWVLKGLISENKICFAPGIDCREYCISFFVYNHVFQRNLANLSIWNQVIYLYKSFTLYLYTYMYFCNISLYILPILVSQSIYIRWLLNVDVVNFLNPWNKTLIPFLFAL